MRTKSIVQFKFEQYYKYIGADLYLSVFFCFQVKAIHLYPELFSVENGLLTPTLKNKRPNLKKFFSTQIQEMYSDLT